MERLQKLQQLKEILQQTEPEWHQLTSLENYFLSNVTGCQCKKASVIAQLNRFWETDGNNEYNQLKNQE